MGDGSSGSFGGFSEFIKDVGGKVASNTKSSLGSFKNTVVGQVTGQTPAPKQNSQASGSQPPPESASKAGVDMGGVFLGEKNAQTAQPSASQQQQQLQQMATQNKQRDEAGIADVRKKLQELQGQHKQVYYDPLVKQIEGKDKQEKPVAQKLEEEEQQEKAKEFELQQEERKKQLPKPSSRETGRGAKG